MSDERSHDPWTDERIEGAHGNAASDGTGQERESPAVLRERQMLAQTEMMDRWLGEMVKERRRSRRWKIFFRLFRCLVILFIVAVIAFGVWTADGEDMPSTPHVGVIEVKGVIDGDAQASAERIIEGLDQAWNNPAAKAVVLHINSPGGSPVQSQRVYDEIRRLHDQGGKPIVAVIEDIGASGAYYIASAADDIYAAPASLVGSIGVIYSGFGLQGAIDKLGVERRVFTSGENKDFLDPFTPIGDEQRQFWQEVLDTTHRQFIDDVKKGRGDRLSNDPQLFSGLIWTGEQALPLGLIDGLKGLDQFARETVGSDETVDYTPDIDPFEKLSRQFGRVAAEWLGLDTINHASPLRYQAP
ncbi:signal peptide peptidase SppA [Phytohalomonas tamaricis]|uniref:signal peptide peptidase SppA n=1 Tax=Phytohalomonas tamaricis TaxID=2081032 RepID=UPI000D0B13F8|nr:signal peptide peptidase SppA [Phytohalomonas tamaricis]